MQVHTLYKHWIVAYYLPETAAFDKDPHVDEPATQAQVEEGEKKQKGFKEPLS